jgi:3-hydroxyacyl-CoA dehydrogenase/enoyl-CoA hydratase/3-hydroxybutyryl-CoA epimerase
MFALQDGIPIRDHRRGRAALRHADGTGGAADVVGLDVCKHVGDIVSAALNRQKPDTSRLDALIAAKKLGRRAAKDSMSGGMASQKTSAPRAAPPADLRSADPRTRQRMRCSAAGKIVADADLVDAGVIFGSGFAPFRGGPQTYARRRGVDAVVARLTELARAHGPRFTPDKGWSELRVGA